MEFKAVKGTRDFYPEAMRLRRWIVDAWRKVSLRNGFEEYDSPRTIRVPNILGYDIVTECTGVLVFLLRALSFDPVDGMLHKLSRIAQGQFILYARSVRLNCLNRKVQFLGDFPCTAAPSGQLKNL